MGARRRVRGVGHAILVHPLLNRILPLICVVAGILLAIALARLWGFIGDRLWILLQAPLGIGLGNTVVFSVSVIVIGTLIGFFFGWARVSGHPIVAWPVAVYIDLIRGIPALVLIIFANFWLPFFLGSRDPNAGLTFSVIALGMHTGAYQAEIFRAGFQSIPRGQVEAAAAVGLSHWQSMRFVILPQTFRVSLPALGNEFATVIKDTSLLSAIGAAELSFWGRNSAQSAFGHLDWVFAIWIVIALVYFLITYIITHVVGAIEESVRVPGLGSVSV